MRYATPILVFIVIFTTDIATADELKQIVAKPLTKLFETKNRIENFRHVERFFPVKSIRRGKSVFRFKESHQTLNNTYRFDRSVRNVKQFLERTVTTGLLIVKDDVIVAERYHHGNTRDSLNTSMSVAKSLISALVGIAIDEGHIVGVNETVTRYLPELKGTAYAGVPIKHVLQMSSGVLFSEEYADADSDFNRLFCKLARGQRLDEYVARLRKDRPSGKAFHYASIDTQVLAMLVERTSKQELATYIEEKLWKPLGMEANATWCTDNYGNQIAFVLFNSTLRDYAKFGRLYLRGGDWNGRRIVSKSWVEQSVHPDRADLLLKDHYGPGWDIGYQYQWWVPKGDDGEFVAIGIWGQYLYVNPKHRIVIVKTSVDPEFDERDRETIAVFRAITAHLQTN